MARGGGGEAGGSWVGSRMTERGDDTGGEGGRTGRGDRIKGYGGYSFAMGERRYVRDVKFQCSLYLYGGDSMVRLACVATRVGSWLFPFKIFR